MLAVGQQRRSFIAFRTSILGYSHLGVVEGVYKKIGEISNRGLQRPTVRLPNRCKRGRRVRAETGIHPIGLFDHSSFTELFNDELAGGRGVVIQCVN
jgi:hypothetical protein